MVIAFAFGFVVVADAVVAVLNKKCYTAVHNIDVGVYFHNHVVAIPKSLKIKSRKSSIPKTPKSQHPKIPHALIQHSQNPKVPASEDSTCANPRIPKYQFQTNHETKSNIHGFPNPQTQGPHMCKFQHLKSQTIHTLFYFWVSEGSFGGHLG